MKFLRLVWTWFRAWREYKRSARAERKNGRTFSTFEQRGIEKEIARQMYVWKESNKYKYRAPHQRNEFKAKFHAEERRLRRKFRRELK